MYILCDQNMHRYDLSIQVPGPPPQNEICCQAQLQLTSLVTSQTELALNLVISTPTHTPGKVEIQLEIGYMLWLVDSWGMVCQTLWRILE